MTIPAIIARYWQYFIGGGVVLALVLGCWWHGRVQYRAGVAAERVRWEVAQAAAEREASQRATDRKAAADTADRDAAARIETQTIVETKYVDRVREIYRDRDDSLCVDADGMRLIADADRDRAAVAQPTGNGPG